MCSLLLVVGWVLVWVRVWVWEALAWRGLILLWLEKDVLSLGGDLFAGLLLLLLAVVVILILRVLGL